MKYLRTGMLAILGLTAMLACAAGPRTHYDPSSKLSLALDVHFTMTAPPALDPSAPANPAPMELRKQTEPPVLTSTSFAAMYDFAEKAVLPVVIQPTGKRIEKIFGHADWYIDIGIVAGVDTKEGKLTGGFSGTRTFTLASNVSGIVGVAARFQEGRPTLSGVLAGLSFVF